MVRTIESKGESDFVELIRIKDKPTQIKPFHNYLGSFTYIVYVLHTDFYNSNLGLMLKMRTLKICTYHVYVIGSCQLEVKRDYHIKICAHLNPFKR